jgi:hypothetical protein
VIGCLLFLILAALLFGGPAVIWGLGVVAAAVFIGYMAWVLWVLIVVSSAMVRDAAIWCWDNLNPWRG